jgi:hypothetical protein
MDRAIRTRSLIITAAVACAAVMLPAVALAASAGPGTEAGPRANAAPASTPQCKASSIEVWLGLNPDGAAAGSVWYPIEFTNNGFGTHTCYLAGKPTIFAVNAKGQRVGPVLKGTTRGKKIILKVGQSAYTRIGIVDSGIVGGCTATTAAGLEVTPPGQSVAQPIASFTFPACKNNKQFMFDLTLAGGIGIP